MKAYTRKQQIIDGHNNRNNICIMGGKLYNLSVKLEEGGKITKTDLNRLKSLLTKIDKNDQKRFEHLITTN